MNKVDLISKIIVFLFVVLLLAGFIHLGLFLFLTGFKINFSFNFLGPLGLSLLIFGFIHFFKLNFNSLFED